MVNRDRILIICNLHRASRFFDSSLQRLQAGGYQHILLQDTGRGLGTTTVPVERFVSLPYQVSYDAGMENFRRNLLMNPVQYDTILLVDSDAFYAGTAELDEYIAEFQAGDYDFVCHTVRADVPDPYRHLYGDGQIAPVAEFTFSEDPYNPPCPSPHFENSCLLFSARLWRQIPPEPFSHQRLLVAAGVQAGGKFGVRQVKWRGTFSNYTREWFHVGNLIAYFYTVERGDFSQINPQSTMDMSRLGYFLAEQQVYGDGIYAATFRQHLDTACRLFGRDHILSHWRELTLDTCMENWVA